MEWYVVMLRERGLEDEVMPCEVRIFVEAWRARLRVCSSALWNFEVRLLHLKTWDNGGLHGEDFS